MCFTASDRPLHSRRYRLLKLRTLYYKYKKSKVNAYRKYLNTRAGEDFNAYATARNQTKWACRNAVKEHERTIAQQAKTNPKAFCSHVNHKLKTKSSIPT